jgi:hypothetical protein
MYLSVVILILVNTRNISGFRNEGCPIIFQHAQYRIAHLKFLAPNDNNFFIICIRSVKETFFDVSLTVHLSITLPNYQRDAKIF